MQRKTFRNQELTLSYLDVGGSGEVLIALHAHWMEGSTFTGLTSVLAPAWRVVALDQRGHGYSDHAKSYTRDDYLADLLALFVHLQVPRAVLLGNSLGGVNSYQFAARYPDRVRGLIIEDIGAQVADDTSFAGSWAGVFKTEEELANRIGPRITPYLRESFREVPGGWRLAFDPLHMVESQKGINGDHWGDWLATNCPALLLRGEDSRVTSQEQLEQMAARRPNTRFKTLGGGHVIHIDNPEGFASAVKEFLRTLQD